MLCFVVVMQSFIMNSHEVFIHIHQGCFTGTGAIVRLPQCQWSKPDGYGKISQCITTTKHNKAKTVCIFLGIYCTSKGCFCPDTFFVNIVLDSLLLNSIASCLHSQLGIYVTVFHSGFVTVFGGSGLTIDPVWWSILANWFWISWSVS